MDLLEIGPEPLHCMVLRRVFDEGGATRAGACVHVGAFIGSPTAAREARAVLGIPFEPLQLVKARDLPSQQSFVVGPDDRGIDPIYPD